MATTYLSRTPASSGTLTTWTYSCWVKRLKTDDDAYLIWANDSGTTDNDTIIINSSNVIYWNIKNSNSAVGRLVTNQVFRDTSAWYHLVFVWDTTNATSGDRMRIYVNGERVTSFSTETQPSQDATSSSLNANKLHLINEANYGGSYQNVQTDILMAHVHFIDGTAYDASTFGETDATTGIWKPKTAPSVTYGTNGFFLKFENSGAFGTDSSGNSNNFTVNGTMTQTIDTPSNVFATWNPLIVANYQPSFSNGNTRIQFSTSGSTNQASSTLAANSGKYYSEFKIDASGTIVIGITASQDAGGNSFPGRTSQSWGMLHTGAVYVNDNTSTYPSYGDSFTTGDIIGIAMDLDNNYLYFSKNGTWQNSADPTSGATGTGAIDISSSSASDMMFSSAVETGSCAVSANFGNGYFGTTAVSSAQNPDDGIGIFEYSVPTGYKALCTKSINAQEYD